MLFYAADRVLHLGFSRGLRTKHPNEWKLFGSENIWMKDNFWSQWDVISIMINRTYAGVGSADAIAYCDRFRIPLIGVYFGGIVSALFFLVLWFT